MSDHIKEKDRGWLLPSGRKEKRPPGLYLLATPIGNLGDITLRALDVLNDAQAVICEDTRVAGRLLSYYGLKKELVLYNDHSDEKQRKSIIEKIKRGGITALISDAGMPLVSDPGYKLVRACIDEEIYITSLPGANAPLTALQLSGLPADNFSFLGFLPAKQGQRRAILEEWQAVNTTLIVFETAPRLLKTLQDVKNVMGERDMALARELTKLHEEMRRGKVSELIDFYARTDLPKGEIVLVIGAGEEKEMDLQEVEAQMRKALKTMRTKEAADTLAETTGWPRKKLYALALRLSDER